MISYFEYDVVPSKVRFVFVFRTMHQQILYLLTQNFSNFSLLLLILDIGSAYFLTLLVITNLETGSSGEDWIHYANDEFSVIIIVFYGPRPPIKYTLGFETD